jgi:hypothetical protein
MSEYKEKTSMLGWALGTFLQGLFNLYLPLMAILMLYVLVCGKQAKSDCIVIDNLDRFEYYNEHALALLDYPKQEYLALVEVAGNCTLNPEGEKISREVYLCDGDKIYLYDRACKIEYLTKVPR